LFHRDTITSNPRPRHLADARSCRPFHDLGTRPFILKDITYPKFEREDELLGLVWSPTLTAWHL